jgi:hypothetical protein
VAELQDVIEIIESDDNEKGIKVEYKCRGFKIDEIEV